MFSPDSDYEVEEETIQARLLPSAEQTLDQLEATRELADHQGANRGVFKWLDGVETQPVGYGSHQLLLWDGHLPHSWVALALFSLLVFTLGFAAGCFL
ncbi:hypothetical protein COCVIDRAFT_90520 [Bipolaris victoriae FI3]|uniref:Uncharacterized protein n=1 Tax=Bipolaris victoriae (strain FI3) TaxID=930091 RepID=W7EQK3_BIPV3|nr:hypothetical protein COCVIDRAFT_90520 [Bipolaris victoriae FI3]